MLCTIASLNYERRAREILRRTVITGEQRPALEANNLPSTTKHIYCLLKAHL